MYTSVVFHFYFVSLGIMQAKGEKKCLNDIERHLEQLTMADLYSLSYLLKNLKTLWSSYWTKQNANLPRFWH